MINREREAELQAKYHHKVVRIKSHYNMPDVRYIVTACLYQGDEFIFAIIDEDYKPGSSKWITIHMNDEEVAKIEERFELDLTKN